MQPDHDQGELYGMLFSVGDDVRLLLPRNVVAEVCPYTALQPLIGAPGWILGSLPWLERRIPVVSLAHLFGNGQAPASKDSRLAIWHALDDHLTTPAYAVVCKGFPTLLDLTAENLTTGQLRQSSGGKPIAGQLALGHVLALVPDLAAIERALAKALGRGLC